MIDKQHKQNIYFPNLNGLRFIAAFLVMVHHIEQVKGLFKIPNYWDSTPFVVIVGKLGVVLFFVLSGFLITYLLLAEEKSFGQIKIKNFYVRRVLRIWPLYFLTIFLAFAIYPNIDMFLIPGHTREEIYSNLPQKLMLYVCFLPNLVIAFMGVIPYASHTWSIGTEEQYYLVWPVILKYVKRHRLALMFFIIVFYMLFAKLLSTSYAEFIPFSNVIHEFWATFNIDCMAIGGVYAILLFEKHWILKYLQFNILFYLSIALVLSLMVIGYRFPYGHYEFYAIFFGIIILNFASNDTIKISFENRLFNYLGNISYGLYMYHIVAIVMAIMVAKELNLVTNWFIYPLTLAISVFIAGLSYKYFETYFLKFKNRFTTIKSGRATS